MDSVGGAVRIGDLERDAAVEVLGDHLRAGRLDPHEYEQRVGQVAVARTADELRPVFADLPGPHPAPAAAGPGADAGRRPAWTPLGGRLGTTLVAVTPVVAVIVLIVTGQWWVLLAIPVVSVVVFGGHGRSDGHDRADRRARRARTRP